MFKKIQTFMPFAWKKIQSVIQNTQNANASETVRIDKPKCSQSKSFFMQASHVYTIFDTEFYLGSAWNCLDGPNYLFHINCAATEIQSTDPFQCVNLNLIDNNEVSLISQIAKIQYIIDNVFKIINTPSCELKRSKILVTCWNGASRSTAVLLIILIVILKRIKAKHVFHGTIESHYNKIYNQVKASRPCVCMSQALKSQSLQILREGLVK